MSLSPFSARCRPKELGVVFIDPRTIRSNIKRGSVYHAKQQPNNLNSVVVEDFNFLVRDICAIRICRLHPCRTYLSMR